LTKAPDRSGAFELSQPVVGVMIEGRLTH
jgi:hypothetical protein